MRSAPTPSLRRWTCALSPLLALMCAAFASQGAIAGKPDRGGAAASSYDISQGSLDQALQAFADRANVQLLYSPSLVRGKRSSGLKGHLVPTTALTRLLAGHGLTAVAVNPNTYLLQPAQERRQRTRPITPAPATVRHSRRPAQAAEMELAPVNVIGTRIPRTTFETSTPVTVISAEEIARSGHGTLYELLREQPGMFGHHPIAVSSEGGQSFHPIVTAATTSLYSLGPRATLFLVDGRRVASFGLVSSDLGGLFDLNGIPLSFIDRIEVLRGGASAVYGADAMAGTVNIVLKKDDQGGEIATRFGTSERGDAQSRRTSASMGAKLGSGGSLFLGVDITSRDALDGDRRDWHTADLTRFGLPDGRTHIGYSSYSGLPSLPFAKCLASGNDPDSPSCRFDGARYRTLQPGVRQHSAYAHWQQPLASSVSVHASGRYARIEQDLQAPPMAAYLPLPDGHPDRMDHPGYWPSFFYAFYDIGAVRNRSVSEIRDIALGLDGTVGEWNWHVDLSRSDDRVHSAIDNVLLLSRLDEQLIRYRLNGTNSAEVLDSLKATIRPEGRDSIELFEAAIDGTLFTAPGGPAKIVAGVALRKEHLISDPDPLQVSGDLSLGAGDIVAQDLRSRNVAAFAELDLPLHRTLQADVAVRLDRYDGFEQKLSPRAGLKWTPDERLLVRASVGRGYRAPSLQDRRNPFEARSWVPRVRLGADPDLLPCTGSETGFCDLEYGTAGNPNLRPESSRSATAGIVWAPSRAFNLSLDYYRLSRRDEFGISDTINHPERFPDGFIRDSDGVLYRISEHLANIGRSDARGWEFESNYLLRSGTSGNFNLRLGAHYLQRNLTSTIIEPEGIDRAGHDSPKLSVLGSARWQYGDWTTTLAMRHFGRSHAFAAGGSCAQVNRDAGKCTNPSTTLFGLNLDYSGLERWTFSLNVNNLGDRQPVNYRTGWDGYNIAIDDPYGRYYTLSATYRF